eukprot:CAMPEP_0119017830 /NCGR_PEP_ID=MMETSP1176-20130426/17823_1 /TAXON_ID=265551 /ORGANISM="Synedropsis recta cf, Strain CCMP1620" /LENGTH=237 /DNA_ID=CAMNT_0006971673 /DNA_START=112 /DNA_END=825 /DNA_ORIENTATION=-
MGFRSPLPAFASTANDAPVVAAAPPKWPSPEFLEPIYELKLSVYALVVAAAAAAEAGNNAKKWRRMKTKLDRFVSPKGMRTTMSERDTYREIALKYTSRIQYANDDKEARLAAMDMDNALTSLESLRKALETATTAEGDANNDAGRTIHLEIERCAREAQRSLAAWLDRIPDEQVRTVAKLIEDVRGADNDRYGWLNGRELKALPEDEQGIWERRVELFGRSKVERNLGFKLTEQSY